MHVDRVMIIDCRRPFYIRPQRYDNWLCRNTYKFSVSLVLHLVINAQNIFYASTLKVTYFLEKQFRLMYFISRNNQAKIKDSTVIPSMI